MVQAEHPRLTLDEFLGGYPETGRYELHQGVVVELQPTGDHEEIAGFIATELALEIRRSHDPYFIPRSCIVKPLSERSGYQPDVIVLDREALAQEPLWKRRSTISQGNSVKLVVEVISTNWRVDYGMKLEDYEEMGIPEYWLVDYKALAATRHIGSPKQPTITVCTLINGEYQLKQYRQGEMLVSHAFPELRLQTDHIFHGFS